MKTSYRIHKITNKMTIVHEYWDDILIFKYNVYSPYHGGNIEEFINSNYVTRNPNFDGLNEFHRRSFILDSY